MTAAPSRSLSCPECAVPMQAFFLEARDLGPAVELDRCPKCARLWFDPNELERSAGRHFLPRTRGATSERRWCTPPFCSAGRATTRSR